MTTPAIPVHTIEVSLEAEERETSRRREELIESLEDKEFRDVFVEEWIDTGLPFQVRSMRESRGWSQEHLGELVGMTQAGISRLESMSYGRYTISTLKRLASAFDVALVVRFVPYSNLVNHVVHLSPDDVDVPDFEHDESLRSQPTFYRPHTTFIAKKKFSTREHDLLNMVSKKNIYYHHKVTDWRPRHTPVTSYGIDVNELEGAGSE